MKCTHLLITLSAALLLFNNANAQIPGVSTVTKALPKVDLGVKLGANFQQLNGTNVEKSYNGGVMGGIFLGIHKNRIGVQAEALVKTVKYNFNIPIDIPGTATNTSSVNTLALEVPVLFEYRLFWRIWGQIGPEFSSILSAKSGSNDVKNDFDSHDFAGVIGLEAHLPFHLNIGARYVYGITNINNESVSGVSGDMKNRTTQLYIGFRIL